MKKATKVLSLMLVLVMAMSLLAACGDKKEDTALSVTDGGKVLNIRVWNEEFKSRVTDFYPGYEKVDDVTGKIGDVTVKWNIVENADNKYQDALDAALEKQSSAAADDKIDIFLVEADYALKYVDTDYTVNVKDLGIDVAKDLANQYKYTQDIVTDGSGALKGVSWQGCPGVLIYNREIAKAVLGTDDPAEVQKSVADWATFEATAAKMKEAGYFMVSGYDDTYRVFSNNVSTKWVDADKKLTIDENIMNWVDQTKKFTDAGYNNKSSLWNDVWSQGFYPEGNVFCYFGPAWFIDFSMHADKEGSIASQGGWGATTGPQGFFWGGTWICAAAGTDNKTLVKDIMLTMTTNEEVMKKIVVEANDFVNNKNVMNTMAADTSYQSKVLGGQNALGLFAAGVDSLDLSKISAYDQGCNEEFQKAMMDYFNGKVDKDTAIANFKAAIVKKYPAIKVD